MTQVYADEIFDILMGNEDMVFQWKICDLMVIYYGLMFTIKGISNYGHHVKVSYNPETGIHDIEFCYPNYSTKSEIRHVLDWGIVNVIDRMIKGE